LVTYAMAIGPQSRGPGAIPDLDVFYDRLVAGFDEVLALAD
jgi:hypothetical protein